MPLATARQAYALTTCGDHVIRALSEALYFKDPTIHCHSVRTATITVMLCNRLRLSRQTTAIVSCAAIIHDIGKIGIPDAILHKSEPLAPDEFEVMKTHAVIGWTICSKINCLQEVAITVRHHHERLDGSGYPDGLRGAAIPLTATILAVADAYDAVTTARSYQPARPHDQALAELQRCAGTQFHPDVITALLTLPPDIARSREGVTMPSPLDLLLTAR